MTIARPSFDYHDTNDIGRLHLAFVEMRAKQAQLLGRTLTPTDEAAGRVIFDTAIAAARDVQDDCHNVAMRSVALSTGTGKSTSAYAFMAAAARVDPEFSAAYIVPTVRMGIEAQDGIEALLGPESAVLWSSYHKPKGRDLNATKEELGFVPTRLVARSSLSEARVLIVTHKCWEDEQRSGEDHGVTHYMGQHRRVVFVDEAPDLVEILTADALDVQHALDELRLGDASHPWVPLFTEIAHRMNSLIGPTGQTYAPAALVGRDEVAVLANATVGELREYTDSTLSDVERLKRARGLYDLAAFLRAAADGCCFYSRIDRVFVAYSLGFRPSPGHVLLDATSDIAGLVSLSPHVRPVKVPPVSFRNLDTVHVDMPREHRRAKDVCAKASTATAYAAWIREALIANTAPGDDVLLIVHKAMLDHEYVKRADDPDHPHDWDGRRVNTGHWGAGVGLNVWKDKTVVFLAGEWHPKRASTIANFHAWSGSKPTGRDLKKAEGKRVAGELHAPQGAYLDAHEGHLLRWTKQLAMRGAARNVDADGHCGHMKLITTADSHRLDQHFGRLFPGAPMPRTGFRPTSDSTLPRTGRAGLCDLLRDLKADRIGADEVEQITGIRTADLMRALKTPAVKATLVAYRWRLAPASALGLAGRRKFLVRDGLAGSI